MHFLYVDGEACLMTSTHETLGIHGDENIDQSTTHISACLHQSQDENE